jgi:hypothetical protein
VGVMETSAGGPGSRVTAKVVEEREGVEYLEMEQRERSVLRMIRGGRAQAVQILREYEEALVPGPLLPFGIVQHAQSHSDALNPGRPAPTRSSPQAEECQYFVT